MQDLQHGAVGDFGNLVESSFRSLGVQFKRVGISGAGSNCGFLATLSAHNQPLVDGKDTLFRDLSLDIQVAVASGERARVANALTQEQLDAAFEQDAASKPTLAVLRARLQAEGDVDERALVLISHLRGINIFVCNMLLETDGKESVSAVTWSFFGGFDPMRRTIALYNRMLVQVERTVSMEDLDADDAERWRAARPSAHSSGHFEFAQDADGDSCWEAESDAVRVGLSVRVCV